MRLRVRYHRPKELVDDHAQQLSRGGMLVRVDPARAVQPGDPPEALQQFAPVTLVLLLDEQEASVDAQVVQTFPGVGVAVTFANAGAFDEIVATARARGDEVGEPAEHGIGDEVREKPRGPAFASNEKMGMALRGNRDDRATILRENNPTLHVYVLRNPGIQLDEITALAKSRTVTPELLKLISERREWQRPDVAIALVRNPKTPVGIAVRMLDHVSITDLRQLAKDTHTRAPIQQAARKKVLGGK